MIRCESDRSKSDGHRLRSPGCDQRLPSVAVSTWRTASAGRRMRASPSCMAPSMPRWTCRVSVAAEQALDWHCPLGSPRPRPAALDEDRRARHAAAAAIRRLMSSPVGSRLMSCLQRAGAETFVVLQCSFVVTPNSSELNQRAKTMSVPLCHIVKFACNHTLSLLR